MPGSFWGMFGFSLLVDDQGGEHKKIDRKNNALNGFPAEGDWKDRRLVGRREVQRRVFLVDGRRNEVKKPH